ncbi:acyl-CoA dehydrogenase family protein [Paenibacillus thailandensis]|uniref:Acyl-CoA dehydrogenase family protein n=1 Tax=Paenibacillus thailandensis TaxID=393250 RepID=A0ABW5QTV7_9BACL
MHFRLPEETELMRSAIRTFAEEVVGPGAVRRDQEGRIEPKLLRQMAELGLWGVPIPEAYGGAGGDALAFAVVLEELSRCCASTAMAVAAHTSQLAWPLYRMGSDAQKRELLPALAGGRRLGAGYFGEGMTYRKTDKAYSISGSGPIKANAGAADRLLVTACEETVSGKRRSMASSAFIVQCADSAASETGSLSLQKESAALGLRAAAPGALAMDGAKAAKADRLGKKGQGEEAARHAAVLESIGEAAIAAGIAQGAMEAAISYAKQRKQFGTPIEKQQAIAFKLADMAVRTDASRWLAYQAAWRLQEGLPCAKEASAAGNYAVRAAVAVCLDAVQIFGGNGYMQEYGVERMLRDAKSLEAAREVRAAGNIRDMICGHGGDKDA